jgi:5'-nucleotidase (lipoprotein e(P4) family)
MNPIRLFRHRLVLSLASLLFVSACASAPQGEPVSQVAPSGPPAWTTSVVDAALWMQSSAEYDALARQTWAMAGRRMRVGLADTTWTAAMEQQPGYGTLPPAVIVDVDETVLDNSPYAARLVDARAGYSDESWGVWVDQARARAVPGAVQFARLARELGVEVFYVTNRNADLEEGTRRNLLDAGFPPGDAEDVYLLVRERDEWGSDKTTRRAFVAGHYRVLLLVGDDLNDFVSGARSGWEERAALIEEHESKWGSRWIMLPNPTYGSWERALFFGESGLTREEVLDRKLKALDPAESDD